MVIALDVGTAGRAYLYEGEAVLIARVRLDETFDRAEALENAFCVIDTVHSDAEERAFDAELFAKRSALLTGAPHLLGR